MNVHSVREGDDIFDAVLKHLVREEIDFSKNIVIFPGKRPSYFLIDKIRKDVKNPFISPIILSIDEFIDYCYEKELGCFDRKIDPLSGCKIIKDLLEEEKNSDFAIDNINYFIPLGLKIFSTLEEMLVESVSKEALKKEDFWLEIVKEYSEGEEEKKLQDLVYKNCQRLSKIYSSFYEKIEKNKFSTRSLRYKKVSESDITLKQFERVIFVGFFALTECERKIFEKFKNNDKAIFLFQGESAENYALKKIYKTVAFDISKIELYECPDSHSEVFHVASLLENNLKEKRGEETFLIILPTAEPLIPLINNLNLNLNEDYNVSIGYPLVRTPLFSFIKHLSSLYKTMKDMKIYVPAYISFLFHPYTKNIIYHGSAENSRIIFHTLEEILGREKYILYKDLKDFENEDICKNIQDIIGNDLNTSYIKTFLEFVNQNTINKFLEVKNIRDFAEKLKDLIKFVYEKTTAKNHILFFPYCEAMHNALTDLKHSLFATEKFEKISDYFDFFEKFISLYSVPFKGTPIKDIQVLGFLESRNLKFDYVYILDVNEGIIPNSEREDELLPFDVRKRLGVPTYIEKDILFEYYLGNIIAGAKKVSMFYLENGNREKSRFVEKIIWEKQKEQRDLDKSFVRPIYYSVNLSSYKPQEIKKTDSIKKYLKEITFSATKIDTYLNCPLKFYYRYVILPDETEEIKEELGGVDVGNIIHEILKIYFDERKIYYEEGKLENVIDKVLSEKFGRHINGKILILKYQIQKKLGELIKDYKKIVNAQNIEILDLELEKNTETYIEDIGNIKLKGMIDRVEIRDDKVFIVDYKKASNENYYKTRWNIFDLDNREEWKKSLKSIQLMFYIFLLNKSDYGYKPVNASYLLLEKKDLSKLEIKLFKDVEEEKNNFKFIDAIITKLISEIISKNEFSPTDNLEDCKNCPFLDTCWR